MTISELTELNSGDEVHWTDPDGGICSRFIIIQQIELNGDVVKITDRDGCFLECLPGELS